MAHVGISPDSSRKQYGQRMMSKWQQQRLSPRMVRRRTPKRMLPTQTMRAAVRRAARHPPPAARRRAHQCQKVMLQQTRQLVLHQTRLPGMPEIIKMKKPSRTQKISATSAVIPTYFTLKCLRIKIG